MNSKEKAIELVDKMYFAKDEDGFHSMNKFRAKQCALIAVDEIIKQSMDDQVTERYWRNVKQEIEKL